jgi:hypothetical protein
LKNSARNLTRQIRFRPAPGIAGVTGLELGQLSDGWIEAAAQFTKRLKNACSEALGPALAS